MAGLHGSCGRFLTLFTVHGRFSEHAALLTWMIGFSYITLLLPIAAAVARMKQVTSKNIEMLTHSFRRRYREALRLLIRRLAGGLDI